MAEQYTDPARDVEALAEALARDLWGRLELVMDDERCIALIAEALAADRARVRAETLAEVGRKVYDLPTTRTQAWRNGWNSVSLNDVLGIVRGMAEAGEQ